MLLTLTLTHGADPDPPSFVCAELLRIAKALGVAATITVNGKWHVTALPTDSLSNVLGCLEDEQRRTR